jgi:hypothetical protein
MPGMSLLAIMSGVRGGGTGPTTGGAKANKIEGAWETGSGKGSLGNC